MKHSKRSPLLLICLAVIFIAFLTVSLAEARRVARGPAAGGSVSHHKHQKKRYEERKDFRDDVRRDRRRWRIGTTIAAATFRSLSCRSEIIVIDGFTFYRCSSGWYRRCYSGGSVTYIVVNTPAGY